MPQLCLLIVLAWPRSKVGDQGIHLPWRLVVRQLTSPKGVSTLLYNGEGGVDPPFVNRAKPVARCLSEVTYRTVSSTWSF